MTCSCPCPIPEERIGEFFLQHPLAIVAIVAFIVLVVWATYIDPNKDPLGPG